MIHPFPSTSAATGMGKRRGDDALAGQMISKVCKGQSPDGSWGGSVATTIDRLFALWLSMEGGRLAGRPRRWTGFWKWTTQPMHHQSSDGAAYDGLFFRRGRGESVALRKLRGVPFTPGCSGFIKTGAALYFACAFAQGNADRVAAAYDSLSRVIEVRQGRWCSGSCGNNILLAFAAHPKHSQSAGMRRAVAWLSDQQDADGSWRKGVPFFPTFLALSRAKHNLAAHQRQRALQRLERTQNRDGSWGRSQPLLNTYLVLDAINHLSLPIQMS